MKCFGMFLLAVGAFAVCTLAFAQDEAKPNARYEALKVLEPLIGTWSHVRVSDNPDEHTEFWSTCSWSPDKRMIVTKYWTRNPTADAEPDDGSPNEMTAITCLVWNATEGCIEEYKMVIAQTGAAIVSKVEPKEDGVFELTTIRSTHRWSADATWTVTDNSIHTKTRNAKDAAGEPLPGMEFQSTRIK